jgi:uncharacterized protein (TIGR03546 family)
MLPATTICVLDQCAHTDVAHFSNPAIDPTTANRKGFRMLSNAIAALRKFCRSLLASHAPEQLALGFTIGMIIGLVPKGNLIALSLCVLLFSMRCNKGLGLAVAVLFSCMGPWTDPFAHRLGLAALNFEPIQATYASIFKLPLGPWFGFDNTVVTGSLLMGLYLAYPVYWLTRLLFAAAIPSTKEAAQ